MKKGRMKKFLHSKRLYNFLLTVSFYFFLIISAIWSIIIFLQIGKSSQENYLIIKEYATISLTLFGLTLLSGIFEKRKDEELEVVKDLFKVSLMFLISFIILLFCYGFFYTRLIFEKEIGPAKDIIILFLLFGIILFIISIGILGLTLIQHYLKRYAKRG